MSLDINSLFYISSFCACWHGWWYLKCVSFICVVILLKQTIFEWYLVKLVVKNALQKDTHYKKIRLCVQNIENAILGSMINIMGVSMWSFKEKGNLHFDLLTLASQMWSRNLKQEVAWFTIARQMRWLSIQLNGQNCGGFGICAHNRATYIRVDFVCPFTCN
jgi:hypothetical protein